MKRFRTDQQLAAIAGQFVPVKLDVDSPEYREWSRQHPAEGRTIPKLFVIRADGESLYARSGSLSGDALPEMLVAALQNAGGILDEDDSQKIASVTMEFEERLEAGEVTAAIKSLNRLKKMGVPGQLQSYAAPAVELNQRVNEFIDANQSKLSELGTNLASEEEHEKLDAMVKFYELRRQLNGLKQLKPILSATQKRISRASELRELARDAKIIDAAKSATSSTAKSRTQDKLRELINSTKSESVKALGTATLEKLDQ